MPPSGKKICTQSEYFTMYYFNFLAPVVSEIIGESQIYIKGLCAPGCPERKNFDTPQVLAYTYITVKLKLHSSINVPLTESSLYNRFCTKRSPKIGFGGNFGGSGKDSWWESTSVLRIVLFQTSLVQI